MLQMTDQTSNLLSQGLSFTLDEADHRRETCFEESEVTLLC